MYSCIVHMTSKFDQNTMGQTPVVQDVKLTVNALPLRLK